MLFRRIADDFSVRFSVRFTPALSAGVFSYPFHILSHILFDASFPDSRIRRIEQQQRVYNMNVSNLNSNETVRIGLDIGSTTLKCVLLDGQDNIIYSDYHRHGAQIAAQASLLLRRIRDFLGGRPAVLAISGSAGLGVSEACGIPFVQEVYATRFALNRFLPGTDAAIELGGEDAKIIFLTGGVEVRMNGSCAGGTGAFIDQMASLLGMTPEELDAAAAQATEQYVIASRCGVFAKSDIQPLINQGAKKSDIAASIFSAVADQTISGLAQGRPIIGHVAYLGGPLHFFPQLRARFDEALHLTGTCPDQALYYVSLGAACLANEPFDFDALLARLDTYEKTHAYLSVPPLFADATAYAAFRRRHAQHIVPRSDPSTYTGRAYLGIDAGSTTTKLALVGEQGELLYTAYHSNNGSPVELVRDCLIQLYDTYPNLQIAGGASTGYGEDLIRNAFLLSDGIVETVAHFIAAKRFLPDVEFIIDIGGQDMKCLQIANGAIDNIYLNEACSSGCGSFLQAFASALGYSPEEFGKLGLFADRPVDLGSRCTVFMNSSVKQAQKDGASVENISAGLSISVVKNALYKVIRVADKSALGSKIVVQGGTFLNDAVLRAFETELGVEVIRPDIAGLMGAYGAALYAAEHKSTSVISRAALDTFQHTVRDARCGGCANNCRLTINRFADGRLFISGNRCERPVTHQAPHTDLNLSAFKLQLLLTYGTTTGTQAAAPAHRGRIGIPFGLNLYELRPFWAAFFQRLGFEPVFSPPSDRALYRKGAASLPSDTVCFPAKLMHGHVQQLIDDGLDLIFYPCMSYNLDEKLGDRHFNCPVVAYYPRVIAANMPDIQRVHFLDGFVGLHRRRDFVKRMFAMLSPICPDLSLREVAAAADDAYRARTAYLQAVAAEGAAIIDRARAQGKPIIVLAGRPYHTDPEIHHGVPQLIASLGAAVLTEDALLPFLSRHPVQVLNQWTYHARLYAAAEYVATQPDMQLVQLVSFGCGLDAITTDEIRRILESRGKLYTQLKIDEITNLGAVKIRLRSLLAALESQRMPSPDAAEKE